MNWLPPIKLCACGSGKPRYDLVDARNIFVAYVCENCEVSVRRKYRDDIFTDASYETNEPIEEDS